MIEHTKVVTMDCGCGKRARTENAAKGLCSTCFCGVIERRIIREMSAKGLTGPLLIKGSSLESAIALKIAQKNRGQSRAVPVTAQTADDLAEAELARLLLGKKEQQEQSILNSVSREECALYGKIKKMEETLRKSGQPTGQLLQELKKISPDTAFAIAKHASSER